jgi:hypothetical protein
VSRVIVLGCGPAGLVAAHAAISLGFEVVIVSNRAEPSPLHGCQYLHHPIPGYEHVPHVRVSYTLNGTPEQYRKKVYGHNWTGKVSPEDYEGEHDAWDIRETYRLMWQDLIASSAVPISVRRVMNGIVPFVQSLKPDMVISTIPAQALCLRKAEHVFTGHTIYANGTTSAGIADANSIQCDGTPEHTWYRIANVFGYLTTEWPGPIPPPRWCDAVPVVKPLTTDCDCHPEVFRCGRYGTWSKARLVHEVYPDVRKALAFPEDEGPEGKWRK